eukprot:768535-Hanusia_phi.AAC.4
MTALRGSERKCNRVGGAVQTELPGGQHRLGSLHRLLPGGFGMGVERGGDLERGALRADEIRAVLDHFMQKLSAGSGAVYNQTLNATCDIVDDVDNNGPTFQTLVASSLLLSFLSSQTVSSCDASLYGTSLPARRL